MNQKIMFVFNPNAGKKTIKNAIFTICNTFFQKNDIVTVFPTQYPLHAIEILKEHIHQYDILLCSGGDGTLNEIIQAYMHLQRKIPIAYIPSGTVNDFARALKLSSNLSTALNNFSKHQIFFSDICKFNQQYFTYIAAFGAFCEVSYKTSQTIKNALGRAAYFLEALKQLPNIHAYRMKIKTNEFTIEDEFVFGAISNTKSIAGFSSFATSNAQLDDGLFEVLLIKKLNTPFQLQAVISAFMHQKIDPSYMIVFSTNHLEIENMDHADFTLDGEMANHPTTIQIRIENKAVPFLI